MTDPSKRCLTRPALCRVLVTALGLGLIVGGVTPLLALPTKSLMLDLTSDNSHKTVSQKRQDKRPPSADMALNDRRTAVLNRLRNAILTTYGCLEGWPRVNAGPCGRFARDFREQWNSRFREKVNIVFVMKTDGSECLHVMVRLPDGNLYDGGNGVVTDETLKVILPNSYLDEMTEFDLARLDKWSYGLGRSYSNCPNYSDDVTRKLINDHLAQLPVTNPELLGRKVK